MNLVDLIGGVQNAIMFAKSAECMIPSEILAAREKLSCAFIPVSPCFEWHSYHLPMGTDGLISETISRLMVERVGGIYFRALSFGLDMYRTPQDLAAWGFSTEDLVYGMNFPELPLKSEYSERTELVLAVENRLRAVQKCGFKRAFILNQHGGFGQKRILEGIASSWNSKEFSVEYVPTNRFLTFKHEKLKVGGHAGLSETLLLLAFCPEYADLSKLKDEVLSVRKTGILHSKPEIEERYHPKQSEQGIADQIRENILENFEKYIRSLSGKI